MFPNSSDLVFLFEIQNSATLPLFSFFFSNLNFPAKFGSDLWPTFSLQNPNIKKRFFVVVVVFVSTCTIWPSACLLPPRDFWKFPTESPENGCTAISWTIVKKSFLLATKKRKTRKKKNFFYLKWKRDRSVRLFLLPLEVCAYGNLCRRQKDMLTMKEDDVNYLIQQLSVADLRIIVELYLYWTSSFCLSPPRFLFSFIAYVLCYCFVFLVFLNACPNYHPAPTPADKV